MARLKNIWFYKPWSAFFFFLQCFAVILGCYFTVTVFLYSRSVVTSGFYFSSCSLLPLWPGSPGNTGHNLQRNGISMAFITSSWSSGINCKVYCITYTHFNTWRYMLDNKTSKILLIFKKFLMLMSGNFLTWSWMDAKEAQRSLKERAHNVHQDHDLSTNPHPASLSLWWCRQGWK